MNQRDLLMRQALSAYIGVSVPDDFDVGPQVRATLAREAASEPMAARHLGRSVGRPLGHRGRPRSGGAERAILVAGARLLEERGVRRMSMQAVAAAARVSKATIYRRWPSKDALILDLVAGAAEEPFTNPGEAAPPSPPDSRVELLDWVRAGLETGRSPQGAALKHLVRRAAEDPALAASLRRRILERHRVQFIAIVERGMRVGQIRPDLDVETLLDLVSGPLLQRRFFGAADAADTGDRDPAEQAGAIVDMLWPGIRASAGASRHSTSSADAADAHR